jgi:hypothetical protein
VVVVMAAVVRRHPKGADTSPRERLRTAIAERELRQRRVEASCAALDRATNLLRENEASVAGFADVENAILSARADTMKTWARTGGTKPDMQVPEHLMARRKAREEAAENFDAAKVACERLSSESEAARSSLAASERAAQEAALLVMVAEAERIAARLETVKEEFWQLTFELRGIARFWAPSGLTIRPIHLPPDVLATATLATRERQYPAGASPEVQQTAAWRSFFECLLADADATREIVKGE